MKARLAVGTFVALIALVAAGLPAVLTPDPAGATPGDAIRMQSDADTTDPGCSNSSAWACGGWDSLRNESNVVVGVSSRPFVKRLDVTNGDTTTTVIDNPGNDPSPSAAEGSNLITSIQPVNLCGSAQTPSVPPAPPRCYMAPNRVSVSIGYENAGGHRNFDGATTTPSVDSNTIFDLTLGLNTLGQSLRWSFLWGAPQYWNVTNIGRPDATLRVKFKPVLTPQRNDSQGCSAIPVMLCDATTADATFLEAQLLLSLDTTLDPMFTGALFAADHANIGSLEAAPASSPQLTYGVSAPLTIDGNVNTAKFQAFVSDASILNYFGATPEVAATTDFRQNAFALARADGGTNGSNGTPTWTRWSAVSNGSDGWFISIPNISVTATSGPMALAGDAARAAPLAGGLKVRPAKFTVSRRGAAPQLQLRRTGKGGLSRVAVGFTLNTSKCNGKQCRIVVTKLNAKTSTARTAVGTGAVAVVGGQAQGTLTSAAGVLRAGSRVSVMLQVKVGATWKWVSATTGAVG